MIAYTVVLTNDMDRALAFYDALLGEVRGKRVLELDSIVLYAGVDGTPFFAVANPWNKDAAAIGNGSTIGLAADGRGTVDRLYAPAIELGATDEGPPGAASATRACILCWLLP